MTPDEEAEATAERVAKLLAKMPDKNEHANCGTRARPCRDCRRFAPLECLDPHFCGKTLLCRPCAATWRCRMWRQHLAHVRAFHCAVERYPALAGLHSDPKVAAALFWELREAVRWSVQRWMRRRKKT